MTFSLIRVFLACALFLVMSISGSFSANAVTYQEYEAAVAENNKITIKGLDRGDGKDLNGRLYKPSGDGPFPAIIALHGAGGIFPYQLWWAKKISKWGFVVLFVDNYCTRGLLCVHHTDDQDRRRGEIMRTWQTVSLRQRVLDAVAAYKFLFSKSYVNKEAIGLIGWSWGGTSALFAQKLAKRFNLPKGGFKGTIAFYPNLKYVMKHKDWKGTGKINQPTLILYGESDALESEESYKELLEEGNLGPITVVGFKEATRKFDELGESRMKFHPAVGEFEKAFHRPSFELSVKKVHKFLDETFK